MQHFPSDNRLSLKWMHSVAEMRIQQADQDPSPSVVEPLVALVDRLGQSVTAKLPVYCDTLVYDRRDSCSQYARVCSGHLWVQSHV